MAVQSCEIFPGAIRVVSRQVAQTVGGDLATFFHVGPFPCPVEPAVAGTVLLLPAFHPDTFIGRDKSRQVQSQPGLAGLHGQANSLPGQPRSDPTLFLQPFEHRIASVRLGFPKRPQSLGDKQKTIDLTARNFGLGKVATDLGIA